MIILTLLHIYSTGDCSFEWFSASGLLEGGSGGWRQLPVLLFVGLYTAVTQRELWFLGTHFSLNISKQVLTCFSLIATWHKLPPPYIYKRLYNGNLLCCSMNK